MQIQIRWGTIDKSDALGSHVTEQVAHALRHHKDLLTRVDVHLHNDSHGQSGHDDKRVVIEARPRKADPLSVDGTGDDFYKTSAAVAKKLERALRHLVDRKREH